VEALEAPVAKPFACIFDCQQRWICFICFRESRLYTLFLQDNYNYYFVDDDLVRVIIFACMCWLLGLSFINHISEDVCRALKSQHVPAKRWYLLCNSTGWWHLDDGGTMHLWNVSLLPGCYMALYHRNLSS
jgi:hypothetical protein